MRQERMTNLPPFDPTDIVSGAEPVLETRRGALFNEDCVAFLGRVKSESVDTVFADPPFNLVRFMERRSTMNFPKEEYIEWGRNWIDE